MLFGIRRSVGPPPYNPATTRGMTSWLRGDAVSLNGGANVNILTDKTGGGNSFNAGAGGYPQLVATDATANNRETIAYSNASQTYMDGPIKSALLTSTAFTIYVVVKAHTAAGNTSFSASRSVITDSIGFSDNTFGLIYSSVGSNGFRGGVNADTPTIQVGPVSAAVDTWKKLCFSYDGSNLLIREAGVSALTITGATLSNMGRTLRIGGIAAGAGSNAACHFDGWLGEAMFCNVAHTTSEQNDVFGYHATYYAI